MGIVELLLYNRQGMAPENESYPDPLIDEVRQRRRDLLARYDNDLNKLFEAIQRLQAEHPEKMVDHRRRGPRLTGDT